jgi:2-polyprenyl-3-methyl-5-hydroxy-6-metoxy-1,4-benzoquinol methylase
MHKPMSRHAVCHLCDRTVPAGAGYASRGPWSYLQCPTCGLVLLHPVPDETVLRSYYNDAYEVNFESYFKGVRHRSRRILEDLSKHFPNRGRLLEVGCSYGGFLAEARQDGWEVTGIELSETASHYARKQLGLRVVSGSVHDHLEELGEPYQVVILFHVIEHVPTPVQLLELCRRLTKPRGLLVLKTPNVASLVARLTGASWQWLSPPAHLYLYSPKTLRMLLEKSGYQPLMFRSLQGDANNNLFSIGSGIGRRVLSSSSPETFSHMRQTLPVRIVEAACEALYYPFRILIDPWLGAKLWQPELYTLAKNAD